MNAFFIIAGAVATIIGIIAFAVLFCVFIYVRVLGYPLYLYFEKDKKKDDIGFRDRGHGED